ncbi:hypothetical protein PENTCL1PPCAC_29504, partial [Pristionchus entomophagus]
AKCDTQSHVCSLLLLISDSTCLRQRSFMRLRISMKRVQNMFRNLVGLRYESVANTTMKIFAEDIEEKDWKKKCCRNHSNDRKHTCHSIIQRIHVDERSALRNTSCTTSCSIYLSC